MSNFLSILFRHFSFSSESASEAALAYDVRSEVPASPGASVACYSRTKDSFVLAVVETEHKLIQVQLSKEGTFLD